MKTFESTFKAFYGPVLVLVTREPEEIKVLLNSEFCFEKPYLLYSTYMTFGLLTTGGERYKMQRKTINSLFFPTNLKRYPSIINAKVESFFERFDLKLSCEEIEMSQPALDFAFDSMMASMFGIDNLTQNTREKFLTDSEG